MFCIIYNAYIAYALHIFLVNLELIALNLYKICIKFAIDLYKIWNSLCIKT